MEIKIYVDVLFLINLIFDYLLLWITDLLLQHSAKTARLLFAASLGALYAAVVFFLPNNWLYSLPGKLIVGIVMTIVAFRPRSLKTCVQYICVFYAAVLIFGGAAFCLFYFTNVNALFGAVYRNGSLYVNIPISLFLLLMALCYLIIKVALSLGGRIAAMNKQIIPLRVTANGRTVYLHALYDSGNLLQDARKRGVIVAQWQSLKPLFNTSTPEQSPIPLQTLAYHTLQGSAELKAFLPDTLHLKQGHRLIPITPVYIGIVHETLNFYHNWDAILPRDFKGVENYETVANAKIAKTFQS